MPWSRRGVCDHGTCKSHGSAFAAEIRRSSYGSVVVTPHAPSLDPHRRRRRTRRGGLVLGPIASFDQAVSFSCCRLYQTCMCRANTIQMRTSTPQVSSGSATAWRSGNKHESVRPRLIIVGNRNESVLNSTEALLANSILSFYVRSLGA